jgi:hypothetical protein
MTQVLSYDSKQPYLGVYNATAVVMYEGQPYSPAWDHVLHTMDIQTLFQLALRSRTLYKVVIEYVRDNMPESCHKDECMPRIFIMH